MKFLERYFAPPTMILPPIVSDVYPSIKEAPERKLSVAEQVADVTLTALNDALDRRLILEVEMSIRQQEMDQLDRVIEALTPACKQIVADPVAGRGGDAAEG